MVSLGYTVCVYPTGSKRSIDVLKNTVVSKAHFNKKHAKKTVQHFPIDNLVSKPKLELILKMKE